MISQYDHTLSFYHSKTYLLLNLPPYVYCRILGTRGAVLHHSAETVLCFRIHVFSFSFFSKSQQRVKSTCLWRRTGPVCLPQYFLFV